MGFDDGQELPSFGAGRCRGATHELRDIASCLRDCVPASYGLQRMKQFRLMPYSNHPRRQLYKGFRAYIRRDRRDLAQAMLAISACVAIILFFNRGLIGGLLTGALITFLGAAILWNYLIYGDALRYLHGAWAEDWTREELQRAVADNLAWHALDNIQLQGGDVDHVLIAPGGVIAVETKFYGKAGRAAYAVDHVRGAARAATRVAGLLTTVRAVGQDVYPVMVIWGPGAKPLADVAEEGGVTVVKGTALLQLLRRYSTGRLAQDHAADLFDALSRYRNNVARGR